MNTRTLGSESDQATADAGAADHLFVVFTADAPLLPSFRFCLRDVNVVALHRGPETRGVRSAGGLGPRLDLFLADPNVSEHHAELHRAGGGWILIDKGSKNGTRKSGQPIARAALEDGDSIEVGQTMLLFKSDVLVPGDGEPDAAVAPPAPEEPSPATLHPDFESELCDLRSVAESAAAVLILGETGTGKGVVARAIHAWSGRPGLFVPVHCGAIPANLIESELFGYARGAFSGAASDRPGLVETAQRGTLFLDEIGDLPPAAQLALLRVLQEREVWPVGARRAVPIDVRIVSATHRDLGSMVEEQTFREDLYARLTGFSLGLPPLRERREDLGLLIASLLRRHQAPGAAVTFTREAMRALFRYSWPRNIRELEKTIEVALPLARGQPIDVRHLPPPVRGGGGAAPATAPAMPMIPAERCRAQLLALLQRRSGNVAAVARDMGLSRTQVRRHCASLGIDLAPFRSR